MFFNKKNKVEEQTYTYRINDELYDVVVKKKNNKRAYMKVNENLSISITAPYSCSKEEIYNFLNSNNEFLIRELENNLRRQKKYEGLYIFGDKKDVVFKNSIKSVKVEDDIIYAPNQKKLDSWYKQETKRIFEERLKFIYDRFDEEIDFPKLKIREMRTRWGVCNVTNTCITLNSRLMKEPTNALDYVIIHELSHLVHANHSKDFWALVSVYCPDYKQIRKELNS